MLTLPEGSLGISFLVLLLCFERSLVCQTFSSLDLESNQLGFESKGLGQKRDNTCFLSSCLSRHELCFSSLHIFRQGGLIEFRSGQCGMIRMRGAKTVHCCPIRRLAKPTDWLFDKKRNQLRVFALTTLETKTKLWSNRPKNKYLPDFFYEW